MIFNAAAISDCGCWSLDCRFSLNRRIMPWSRSWTLDITAPDIFMENYWETERRFSFGRWAQPFNGGFYG